MPEIANRRTRQSEPVGSPPKRGPFEPEKTEAQLGGRRGGGVDPERPGQHPNAAQIHGTPREIRPGFRI